MRGKPFSYNRWSGGQAPINMREVRGSRTVRGVTAAFLISGD